MLKRIFTVGLLAGLTSGLATAALQHVTTVPLILEAETFEASFAPTAADRAPVALVRPASGSAVATNDTPAPHVHGAPAASGTEAPPASDGHHHAENAWKPTDGLERTLSTSAATVVSGIGFALVLMAALILAGERITPRVALAYAAAGFAATGLATGLGLAPELPGSFAAPLADRQLWWAGTAAATAAGLFLLLKRDGAAERALGLALLVAPHVIGAPQPDGFGSAVPAELAAEFAGRSLVVHAVFWALVGVAVGWFWQRGETVRGTA